MCVCVSVGVIMMTSVRQEKKNMTVCIHSDDAYGRITYPESRTNPLGQIPYHQASIHPASPVV